MSNVDWWLDVEILNSWQTLRTEPTRAKQQNDIAALAGAVNALWDLNVAQVGFYSTSYQWSAITGGLHRTHDWFSANPVWLAGFDHRADAAEGCGRRSFTGGPVLMTQYLAKRRLRRQRLVHLSPRKPEASRGRGPSGPQSGR